MEQASFELSNGVTFTVEHNLEHFGLSIDAALQNWLARTKKYSVGSFCNYVTSKDPHKIKCKPVLTNQ